MEIENSSTHSDLGASSCDADLFGGESGSQLSKTALLLIAN
jgi:hypothetical protein